MNIWGSPLYQATKQQLNSEKWDVELGHLPAFGWTMLLCVQSKNVSVSGHENGIAQSKADSSTKSRYKYPSYTYCLTVV